jgi:hypothetical protein
VLCLAPDGVGQARVGGAFDCQRRDRGTNALLYATTRSPSHARGILELAVDWSGFV